MLPTIFEKVKAIRDALVLGNWDEAAVVASELLVLMVVKPKAGPVAADAATEFAEVKPEEFDNQFAAIDAAIENPPKAGPGAFLIAVEVIKALAPLLKKLIAEKFKSPHAPPQM